MPGWDNTPRRPDGGVPRSSATILSSRVVALERDRPSEGRRPGEPARLRERMERMGRGLSPRTRRALRTGVSRSDVERRRGSRTARSRIEGFAPADVRRALLRPVRGISWRCSTPIPSSWRRSAAGSTGPFARRTRKLERSQEDNGAPGCNGGASAPERRSPVGPGLSLIWRGAERDARRAPARGFSTGRVNRARLLPAHPEDRGGDRDHVSRRGLPIRADLSGDRLGRHARVAGRTLSTFELFRGHFGAMLPGSSRDRRGCDDAARSGRARAVGVAVRTPACGSPLLRRSAPAGPELDDLGARTTAEPTGPQPGRRSPRRRPGRRAAPEPAPGPIRRAGVDGRGGVPAAGRDVRSRAARAGDGIPHRLCRGRLRRSTRRLRRAGRVAARLGTHRNRSDCATRHRPAKRATRSPTPNGRRSSSETPSTSSWSTARRRSVGVGRRRLRAGTEGVERRPGVSRPTTRG